MELDDLVENLEVYESVKRWLTKLESKARSLDFSKSSTKRAALFWLKKYCKFLETNPDYLIKARADDLLSTSQTTKRKHEENTNAFIIQLRRDEYAPNSIAMGVGLVRSFYKANYVPLTEVSTVRPYNIRAFKVPSVKDLKKMCENAEPQLKAWITMQKDSGLGNMDLISLSSNNLSSEFGAIKTQLKKGIVPIHVEVRRQKTGEKTDSFFGPNAIEALNEYMPDGAGGKIFQFSARTVEQQVKALGISSKVATKEVPITPYALRRFFNTYMKLAGVNEALVETMMGHSIGRVRSAYLVMGQGQATSQGGGSVGIPISKLAEIYMEAYPTIDITKA